MPSVAWPITNSKGEHGEAIDDYTMAIQLDPKDAWAYRNRGIAYGSNRENDKAIADCNELLRLNPQSFDAYFMRNCLRGQRRLRKGHRRLQRAIRLNPKYSPAYCIRGRAYRMKGDTTKPLPTTTRPSARPDKCHCSQRFSMAPGDVLSRARFRVGQRAIEHATQACELTGELKRGRALDTLAAAYAEGGKFDKAVEFQKKALEVTTIEAEKVRLRETVSELYQDGKPYREPREIQMTRSERSDMIKAEG